MNQSSLFSPLTMAKNFTDDEETNHPFYQQNQTLPSQQTLINNNSYCIEDAFNHLNLSSSTPFIPPYLHQQQQNHHQQSYDHLRAPVSQTPAVNGFINGGILENHLNNSSSSRMINQDFTPQYSPAEMEFQWWFLRNQEFLRARMAASSMRNYSSAPVSPQGFGDLSVPRLYRQSSFCNDLPQVSYGECPYLNPECHFHLNKQCFPQSRVQPFPVRSEQQFRRRSLMNSLRSQSYNHNLQTQLQQNPITLLQMRGQLLALAKDQHGCRFLQKKFEEGTEEEIKMIFMELKGHVTKLMVDPFGNYLVQKLLEVCNEERMTEILHFVTRDQYELVDICRSTHGTRSVQKLLALLKTPQQIARFMSALRIGVVVLCKDGNGHHVIQNCLKYFSKEDNKCLINEVADHCIEIAVDKSGCCVLQQCVHAADRALRDRLVAEITANALFLSQDPFGNYVVQSLVSMRIKHITKDLVRQLKGKFEFLSVQKCSSNVVQRLVKEAEEEESTEVIKELLNSNVLMLIQDRFANYVVQSAMSVAKGPMFNAFVRIIDVHFQSLRNHPYGKSVVTVMNQIIRSRQQHNQHHI